MTPDPRTVTNQFTKENVTKLRHCLRVFLNTLGSAVLIICSIFLLYSFHCWIYIVNYFCNASIVKVASTTAREIPKIFNYILDNAIIHP